ncbi:hypothetical protein BSQ98_13715 [Serratia liquefaciens]|uniref:hypothetical protein n=1 Tax=Serratia liquefaciens TaxID=614 RepID=UPI001022147B|nr:hypothetical protein [Serratia liquefaciens]RYM62682.1 hypothetical protein BSQ98_13715 [Serratia liquefaciens]
MSNQTHDLNKTKRMSEWLTINEATFIAGQKTNITESDIYRHALCGNIYLSIYFQSPVILKKVKTHKGKAKLHPIKGSLIQQLCLLDRHRFLNGNNLTISTDWNLIYPTSLIIDTLLYGYEYFLIQKLLAHSLGIPLPKTGVSTVNYGITVTLSGETFMLFEKMTLQNRIKQQMALLPKKVASRLYEGTSHKKTNNDPTKKTFPAYSLPPDACFVIRPSELERLNKLPYNNEQSKVASTRISTPLSRLFWLACKHNEIISPLIKQPYKLLSIFEQWASDEGMTDKLSGDTLKTALERGSPLSN